MSSFTELDPLFSASVAAQLSASDLTQFHSAADWISNNSGNALYFFNNSGDYYTKNDIDTKGYLTSFTESDPQWNAEKTGYYTKEQIDSKLDFSGLLTNFTELDPLFSASVAAQLSASDLTQFHGAADWISDNSGNAMYFYNNSGSYYTKAETDSLFLT